LSGFDIGWAEAVAVELGICLLVHLGLHSHPSARRFLVRSDNQGVVEMVMKGRCRSKESNNVLKRIYHLLAEARISVKTEHVSSRDNVSDALSRGDIPSFLHAFPRASVKIRLNPPPPSPGLEITVFMNLASSSSTLPRPALKPSPLRPDCAAQDRLFRWKGVNTPPPSTISNQWMRDRESSVFAASISDPTSYGAGIKKFHIFCDLFAIPEKDRLPAPFDVLHSFVLWATADATVVPPSSAHTLHSDPISESTARHYLAAVRAWHIVQGWNPPLTDLGHDRINFSLRGIAKLQAEHHKRPIRPPVTTTTLRLVQKSLNLNSPFDACFWAITTCAFWGMMRLGETTVQSRHDFSPSRYLTRGDYTEAVDTKNRPYLRLDLPSAKTAKPGERQSVWLVPQGDLCPTAALHNMARVVPALRGDPLFSWRDNAGEVRPMAKPRFLERFNAILIANGAPRIYGHSFRIGGASFYMASGVDPKVVRMAGRWRSLAYETYIRSFEQVVSLHLTDRQ